jgi:Holliday junction resolvase
MKNLTLKTVKKVETYLVVPEYFRINLSQYFKIVSNNSYVAVTFYDTDIIEMEGLYLYPEIEVKHVNHLHIYIEGREIIEITKEEFTEKFDACMTFIDKL